MATMMRVASANRSADPVSLLRRRRNVSKVRGDKAGVEGKVTSSVCVCASTESVTHQGTSVAVRNPNPSQPAPPHPLTQVL